ncbi:hypothetical protein ACOME3_001523 [Neoechinorhynchus agilis]
MPTTDSYVELWLVSLPGQPSPEGSWEKLNTATNYLSTNSLSLNFRFPIPALKVGTLDELIVLVDDIVRTDTNVAQLCRKLATYFANVLDKDRDKLAENLVVGNAPDPLSYLTKFQWDYAKFPIRLPLRSIYEIIQKQTAHIESELKSKSTSYDKLNQRISAMKRSQTGSLLVRDLTGILRSNADLLRDDLLRNSDYLKTVLVVVPRSSYNDFHSKYETLTDMIVPRSAVLITEDDNYGLFGVVIFKKVEDSFKYACKQHSFTVRDYESLEANMNDTSDDVLKKMQTEKAQQFGPLVRWLKVNFSECFAAWVHLKALRMFVESVLRYGLPLNFLTVLLQPRAKKTEKLVGSITNAFDGFKTRADKNAEAKNEKELEHTISPELNALAKEMEKSTLPFILYKLDVDFTADKLACR